MIAGGTTVGRSEDSCQSKECICQWGPTAGFPIIVSSDYQNFMNHSPVELEKFLPAHEGIEYTPRYITVKDGKVRNNPFRFSRRGSRTASLRVCMSVAYH